MMRADLHLHTYFSDGGLSPSQVVAEAKKNKIDFIAVTDHDCTLAFDEVLCACPNTGVKTVRGIEVSAYLNDERIHVLGYGMKGRDFEQFERQLKEGSFARAEEIVKKLNENGVSITFEEVLNRRTVKTSPIHAMHIAFACAEKGYSGGNPFTFQSQYLSAGKCAYSAVCRPSPELAVEMITVCGGFASLAHPGRIHTEKQELLSLVKKLKERGLGGIEAVYSTHTVTETAYYKEMAKAFSLEVTGGSDTHRLGGSRDVGKPEYYLSEALAHKFSL